MIFPNQVSLLLSANLDAIVDIDTCSSLVRVESRYGMWPFRPSDRAVMTFPNANRDLSSATEERGSVGEVNVSAEGIDSRRQR